MLTFGSHVDGFQDVADQMIHDLRRRAEACFQAQAAAKVQLRTVAEFEAHRDRVRQAFLDAVGGLPAERAPLQPEVTGRIDQGAYTIEKLIYQSLPDFFVTSLLYVPKEREARTPAILFVCGHAESGKAYPRYQAVCADLAANGFIVLAMDPPGQGERYQYWDPETGRRIIGGCTTEHTYAGLQYVVQGASLARQFVWDAVRAVDLLSSRPDVDPDRIAVTGNSGGGTQSSFLMVAEPRLAAAVPCTFIMTLESYLKTGQSQDSEQIVRGAFVHGPDHDDYLTCMAPKPVLVGAVASDFFPIEGALEAVERARRIYALYGAEDKVDIAIAPGRHEYASELREAAVNWLRRHLQEREPSFRTADPAPLPEETLQCTPEGQVLAWRPQSKTVFDLAIQASVNTSERGGPSLSQPAAGRQELTPHASRLTPHLRQQLAQALGLDGGSPAASELAEARARPIYPRVIREQVVDGYPVEKLFFFSEPDVAVTGVMIHPRSVAPATETVLILLERGTAAIPDERARLEALLRQGRRVFVFDPRGIGAVESRPINPGARDVHSTEFRLGCDAMMAGISTLGLRVLDVLRAYDYLSSHRRDAEDAERGRRSTSRSEGGLTPHLIIPPPSAEPSPPHPISLYGVGSGAIFAYLAAVLEPGFSAVTLEQMPLCYRAMVETRYYNPRLFNLKTMAWGFLQQFDLPDLAGCIAPHPLRFVRPLNAYGEPASLPEWERVWLQEPEAAGFYPAGWRPMISDLWSVVSR